MQHSAREFKRHRLAGARLKAKNLGRYVPEEQIAVVRCIHGEVAGIHLQVSAIESRNTSQLATWQLGAGAWGVMLGGVGV